MVTPKDASQDEGSSVPALKTLRLYVTTRSQRAWLCGNGKGESQTSAFQQNEQCLWLTDGLANVSWQCLAGIKAEVTFKEASEEGKGGDQMDFARELFL